ncbi:MAG: hypothetical protein IT423_10095 [Pirellulaceae bacterium]|nr:hypothetical protein [Pirellulaceae bacterium]
MATNHIPSISWIETPGDTRNRLLLAQTHFVCVPMPLAKPAIASLDARDTSNCSLLAQLIAYFPVPH